MHQTARALVAYFPQEEGLRVLMPMGQVTPGQDPEGYERRRAECEQLLEQHRAGLDRPPYVPEDPRIPTPPEVEEQLQAFAEREDVKRRLNEEQAWTVGFADLTKGVLVYQRVIFTGNTEQRVEGADPEDPASLVTICLQDPYSVKFQGTFDPVQNSFMAASQNPNLRLAGFEIGTATENSAAPGEQVFGFRLSLGATFVQLAEYNGRWIVRDGMHRIYGLLRLGITRIPCVLVSAESFEQTGAGRPGHFGYELLYGDNPPRMTDFLTDLAADIEVAATMKVVRIRAEQFVLPLSEI